MQLLAFGGGGGRWGGAAGPPHASGFPAWLHPHLHEHLDGLHQACTPCAAPLARSGAGLAQTRPVWLVTWRCVHLQPLACSHQPPLPILESSLPTPLTPAPPPTHTHPQAVRNKALMQYTAPFAALDLNAMAAFFNTSVP